MATAGDTRSRTRAMPAGYRTCAPGLPPFLRAVACLRQRSAANHAHARVRMHIFGCRACTPDPLDAGARKTDAKGTRETHLCDGGAGEPSARPMSMPLRLRLPQVIGACTHTVPHEMVSITTAPGRNAMRAQPPQGSRSKQGGWTAHQTHPVRAAARATSQRRRRRRGAVRPDRQRAARSGFRLLPPPRSRQRDRVLAAPRAGEGRFSSPKAQPDA